MNYASTSKVRATGHWNGRKWAENEKGYPYFIDKKEMVHAVVWATSSEGKQLGSLPAGWDIHHVDCNPLNFDISNLVPLPTPYHVMIHARAKGYRSQKGGSQQDHLPDKRTLMAYALTALQRQRDLDKQLSALAKQYAELYLKVPKIKKYKKAKKKGEMSKKQANSAIWRQDRQESLNRFEKNFGPGALVAFAHKTQG